MKLSARDKRLLRTPPNLDKPSYCVFCNRKQPENEKGDGGRWVYFAGTGGHIACGPCCDEREIRWAML